jgi:SPP1 gp7 family putative phage head morphogenesis protein
MNSEQLRLFISGAFGSEAEAKKIRRMLTPSLRKVLDNVRGIIDLLPDESLVRQKVWREMLPAVEAALGPYNDEFAAILEQELPIDGLRAARETGEQMRSLGVPTLGGGAVAPEFVMADSTKFLLNTKVADTRIVDLFTPKGNDPSPFTTSNRRMIDSLVTGGIIKGESTANIAKAINSELETKIKGQAEAIARTAIQDYNRQVKEAVWDANADALEGLAYEWVSALDSRTCTVCAPLDGQERPKRGDFPKTPYHVRCRCQVVLIDPDDPGRVRFGQDAYEDKPTGKGVYKTKKAVKGKELYRKNREVKTVNGESPRYADYLYGSKGVTQEMFFGGGNVGKLRAERFNRYVKNGKSPQDALVDVLRGDKPKTPVVAPRPKPKPKAVVKPITKAKATKKARKVIEKAKSEITSSGGLPSDELLQAVAAATKKNKDKILESSGVNPVALFDESDTVLGRGLFGTAKLTPKGVAKRGSIAKAEIEGLEALGDSGVTPRLLGQAYTQPKFESKTFKIPTRQGTILMEEAKGKTLWSIEKEANFKLEGPEPQLMFSELLKSRKAIHTRGVAHQDMHQGNVLWDAKSKKMTIIDLGLARIDPRAALIEALGTRRGRINLGQVEKPGDYQSVPLFAALNRGSQSTKLPIWKRFQANRKKVESMLAEDELLDLFDKASIRVLPKSISKRMSKERAMELIQILYEGI